MVWWWIGNLILIFVVAPVCLWLLNKLLRPTFEIKAYADDILEHGVGITRELDAVPKLVRTKELTATARAGVGRYANAVNRLL